MDADILRTILNSCGDAGDVVSSEDYKNVTRDTILCPRSDATFDTLCTSLSNLLSYKVSKEAYQRYSVRLLIIDVLRKWCRTTSNFEHLHIFTSEENSLRFVSKLLDRYLTDDILDECYSDDALISLTTAVMRLSIENPPFIRHVDRLLVRLSQLEANDKIDRLLDDALRANSCLKLSTKEEIYVSRRARLIEQPLLDSFMRAFPDTNKEESCVDKRDDEETLNRLLELGAESARVFQSMFNFLKELLIRLQYAPAVIDFIESTLKRVSAHCEIHGRDILDLYPSKLRCCVILLRIKPEHHTAQTREYTLQSMKQIFAENKDALLILMSHFPDWLQFFATYVYASEARS